MHIDGPAPAETGEKRFSGRRDRVGGFTLVLILLFSVILVATACSRGGKAGTDNPPDGGNVHSQSSEVAGGGQAGHAVGSGSRERLMSEGVRSAKLVLDTKEGKDTLGLVITGKEPLPVGMRYGLEWMINGRAAGSGQSLMGFKRDDKVAVAVTIFDGENKGRSKVIETEIRNTTPRVSEVKTISVENDRLSYQVVAADDDGDVVNFSLVNPPQGMKIDRKGRIDWQPGAVDKTDATVTVKITDGHGGEATYPFKMTTEMSQK